MTNFEFQCENKSQHGTSFLCSKYRFHCLSFTVQTKSKVDYGRVIMARKIWLGNIERTDEMFAVDFEQFPKSGTKTFGPDKK